MTDKTTIDPGEWCKKKQELEKRLKDSVKPPLGIHDVDRGYVAACWLPEDAVKIAQLFGVESSITVLLDDADTSFYDIVHETLWPIPWDYPLPCGLENTEAATGWILWRLAQLIQQEETK